MLNRIAVLVFALSIITFSGCSSLSHDNTDTPPVNEPDTHEQSNTMLLGIWNLKVDPDNHSVVEFDREMAAHFDITQLIPDPVITNESYNSATKMYQADVTLQNTLDQDMFDMRLIVYTDDAGHLLKNPDNWTALYDIPDGSFINPFKAYAKSEPSRRFVNGAFHTETVRIYLPGGILYADIQLAVEASFPNCDEPYLINNFTQEYIGSSVGSSGNITIDVFDWQSDVNNVQLMCPVITNNESDDFTYVSGNTWILNVVNNNGVPNGQYLALIGASSTESGNLKLYYFVYISIEWHTEVVDDVGDKAGKSPSLAFSPDGKPGISYHRGSPDYDLMYASKTSGSWQTELVEDLPLNGDCDDVTSLAFNKNGDPSISYVHHIVGQGFNGKLWFAVKTGGSWQLEMIPDSNAVGQHSSLCYDDIGNPMVAYHQFISFSGAVKFAEGPSGSWSVEYVDSNPGEVGGSFTSLALDSNDNPHVSYSAGGGGVGQGELRYAKRIGTIWTIQTVDSGLGGAYPLNDIYTSIEIDSQDRPCIAYHNAITDDLKFAWWDGGSWIIEEVETTGDVGMWCSLALNNSDIAYISYYDLTNHQVKIATRVSPSNWEISVVNSDLGSYAYTSIAMDGNGNPAIAYYDAAHDALKFAYQE